MSKYFFPLLFLLSPLLAQGMVQGVAQGMAQGVAQESEDLPKGTLIVTWQTTDEGQGLDRIHFWVRNRDSEQSFYPKQNAFVEDPDEKSRTVVIENIPPNDYTIEFIIPNQDGFFEPVALRTVTVEEGEVVKVNQKIHPTS